MLQQTQVKTVIPYFNRWMQEYPNWKSLATAPETQVLKSWEGLGYYSRARNLHRLAQSVVKDHQGSIPSNVNALMELPGIGRYTAGAIASLAFSQKAPLVDGNVIRVFARFFACSLESQQPSVVAQYWNLAEALLPTQDFGVHNESLMELGALVCTPQNPQCLLCPLQEGCQGKSSPESFPVKTRIKSEEKNEKIVVLKRAEKYWLIQGKGRQRGFWLFPEFESQNMKWKKEMGQIRYGFTKYRIQMIYGSAQASPLFFKNSSGEWYTLSEIKKIPLPQAHRKIALQLMKTGGVGTV